MVNEKSGLERIYGPKNGELHGTTVQFRYDVSTIDKKVKSLFRICDISLPADTPSCRRRRQFSARPLRRQQNFLNLDIQGVPGGGECARLRENVPYIKVHRSNPKHLYSKLNGYGDNGERRVWPSCGSTYCTCFVYCYPYTEHVRPSVSQPSQAHSALIINICHSYSEL